MTALDTIVAYTYRADTLCPTCTIDAMLTDYPESLTPAARDMREEDVLDQLAEYLGIDREDERMFDSDAFPKVVFLGSINKPEECGHCWSTIE